MKHLLRIEIAAISLTGLIIAYANYLVFMVVPNERIMGAVQRIFYFHVGSAIACYVAFGIVFIAGLAYLARRDRLSDAISEAAAEVGFVFASIVLMSGMIWGKVAWNTWFNWEPRLVSFLLLWTIFLGYLFLRAFAEPARVATQCAIIGIIGALMVPIVIFSVKLLPQVFQLHPQVVENQGLREPLFVTTMFYSMGALTLFALLLIWLRVRLTLIENKLGSQQI
jgi:heme exporter protein C